MGADSQGPLDGSASRESRLDSWKEIAVYLNRHVTTVRRWEKHEGLPVHRHLHDKLGSVYAFRADLDAWWRSRSLQLEAQSVHGVKTILEGLVEAGPTSTPTASRRRRRWPGFVTASGFIIAAGLCGILIAGIVIERAARPSTSVRPEAHELYLRGRLALEDPTGGSARTALELFQKAIAANPADAPAYAGVAQVYLQKPSSIPGVPPDVAFSRAQYAVDRALALDDSQPETHLAAAELRMTARDWLAAGHEYRRAIELAPNSSMVRQKYATWLSYQGRFEEALSEARLGESLDPLSPRALTTVAEVLRNGRRFDEAVVQAQRALELNPNFGRAYSVLGHCYLAQGKLDAAIEAHRRSGNTGGNLGYAYGMAGRTAEARQVLESLETRYAASRVGPGEIAQVEIGLGEFDRAFEWLSRAVDDGSVWTLKVAVVWDPLRPDPRFERLLGRSGYGG